MANDFELSEREKEIIRLVATGASNKEIAQALVISPNTVKVHLRNIFSKLEVTSRTEATMVAIREGWVDTPGSEDESSETEDVSSISEAETLQGKPKSFIRQYGWIAVVGLVLIAFAVFGPGLFAREPEVTPTAASVMQEDVERWESLASMSSPLKAMAAARYEQSFYLVGGETELGVTDQVLKYDANDNLWEALSPIPKAVTNVQAAVLGEKIYVPGGQFDLEGQLVNDFVFIYDPRDDHWQEGANLALGVSDYCMTAFEGKIYLFGGWDGQAYSNSIQVYEPAEKTWSMFGAMPKKTAGCAASVVGGKIHLFGGRNAETVFADHYIFVPQRYLDGEDAWEKAASLPEPRYGLGTTVLAEMVYVAGGENEIGESMNLLQYFPPKDYWAEIDQPIEKIGSQPAVLPFDTRLYVIGGEVDGVLSASQQMYQAVYTILVPIVR